MLREFILSQFEDPNFENFRGATPTPTVNGLGLTVEPNLSPEKPWKSQGIPSLLESVNPVEMKCTLVKFPTYVIGSSFSEIVKTENTKISN